MLSAVLALALSLPAEEPKYTVEFRVLRVPAGRADFLQPDFRGLPGRDARREAAAVLPNGGPRLNDIRLSCVPDAWTAPWVRTAELTGPELRVGGTPVALTLTRPEWTTRTQNEEPLWHSAWLPVRIDTRQVLVNDCTFTASAVFSVGGLVQLCVSYSETERPAAKEPLSPHLAPFYTSDAPAPQPLVPAISERRVVKRAEKATLKPGEPLMIRAGRGDARPARHSLWTRFDDLNRRVAAEEDVIVFATVRK
jgi:hypothetical protein